MFQFSVFNQSLDDYIFIIRSASSFVCFAEFVSVIIIVIFINFRHLKRMLCCYNILPINISFMFGARDEFDVVISVVEMRSHVRLRKICALLLWSVFWIKKKIMRCVD